jgi:aspartate kinase
MDPSAPGTIINNRMHRGTIKAVAAKSGITCIAIQSSRMLLASGFLSKVFEIFETYKTSIDVITTSEVGVSVTIDNTTNLSLIVDELKKYGTVTVESNMCIVCVVGDLSSKNVGFETIATDALKQIPVRMISYGGSAHNISFVVAEADKQRTLQALQKTLFAYNDHVRRPS